MGDNFFQLAVMGRKPRMEGGKRKEKEDANGGWEGDFLRLFT
jgi:hypothetical protein